MALKGHVAQTPRKGPCNHRQQLLSTHCRPGRVLSLLPTFPHSLLAATLEGDASISPPEATKAQRGDTQVCTGVRIQTKAPTPEARPSSTASNSHSPESQGRYVPRGGEEKLSQTCFALEALVPNLAYLCGTRFCPGQRQSEAQRQSRPQMLTGKN